MPARPSVVQHDDVEVRSVLAHGNIVFRHPDLSAACQHGVCLEQPVKFWVALGHLSQSFRVAALFLQFQQELKLGPPFMLPAQALN